MTTGLRRKVFQTDSPEATEALGRRLGAGLRSGDVVALIGPLGAGKTVLASGIAAGAGAGGYIASPSFVVIREYAGPVRIYHADLYRLERPEEIADLGLDELIDRGGVLVIEWADRAGDLLPEGHVRVELAFGVTERARTITLQVPDAMAARLDLLAEA